MPGTPSQIHLSWSEDPSRTLTLTWHTSSRDNPARVEYRVAGAQDWIGELGVSRRSPGRSGWMHRVVLSDVTPDTEVEYRVSSDRGARPRVSETFQTRTAPTSPRDPWDFAFICDTGLLGRPDGTTDGTRQVIEELLEDRPRFILGGGDYAYADRDGRYRDPADAIDDWFNQWEPLLTRFPFMAQFGNHDVYRWECFADWAPRFAHPDGDPASRNYSFEVGGVHFSAFFCPAGPPSARDREWLENDLAAARERAVPWIIVFSHQPLFAHGQSHPAPREVRDVLAPIFERFSVDLHLSGHDQNYERTYPLVADGKDFRCMSESVEEYTAGAGVVYAKISPSGKKSDLGRDFSRFPREQAPFVAVRNDTLHHYGRIRVNAEEIVVQVYGLVGDGSPRSLVDSFRIIRPKALAKK